MPKPTLAERRISTWLFDIPGRSRRENVFRAVRLGPSRGRFRAEARGKGRHLSAKADLKLLEHAVGPEAHRSETQRATCAQRPRNGGALGVLEGGAERAARHLRAVRPGWFGRDLGARARRPAAKDRPLDRLCGRDLAGRRLGGRRQGRWGHHLRRVSRAAPERAARPARRAARSQGWSTAHASRRWPAAH